MAPASSASRDDHYAADTIECEGVGYATMHYCDGSTMESPETARLWDEAADACRALIAHLEASTGREL